jgi:hypothetical protein
MAMMMIRMVASTAERRNGSGMFCFFLGWTTILGTDSFQKEYETLVAMIDSSTDRTNTNSPAA